MSTADIRATVHAALRTVQGTKHHLGFVTLDVLTNHVTEAVEQLVDAHRAEVLVEEGLLPKADVVAWLVKKAREETPVWLLASKVDRGAVRPDNLRMLPADFFEPGRTYQHSAWQFRCDTVTTRPDTNERVALGWFRFSDGEWGVFSATETEWADGWTDVTEGGAS